MLVSELRWFHIFVWIFHEVAFAIALFITVVFWSLLPPSINPISINSHVINTIIMLADLFVCAIPFRLLHFYHVALCALAYTVFSLILHGVGFESAIYSVLDWVGRPGFSIGLVLISIFVGSPLSHLIGFGLYHLRWFIARRCSRPSGKPLRAEDNKAFSA